MKSNYFTSLLLIILTFSNQNFVKSQSPPESFELQIQIDNGEIMSINLQRVETFLVFPNLPVKIIIDESGTTLRDIGKKTMRKIGDVTMYHDYCTKSAFVYFHKTQKLHGVIGSQYSITDLPMNRANRLLRIKSKYLHVFHPDEYVKKTRYGRSIEFNSTGIRSPRELEDENQPVFYPELLVVVSHNMHGALGSDHVKTVSHVLTVYNAVDMLFRLVQSVTIRINIATILIETMRNSLAKIGRPTPSRHSRPPSGFIGPSVYSRLSTYFQAQTEEFPRDAYDFIAYNTRTPLRNLDEEDVYVFTLPAPRDFLFPSSDDNHRISLSVRDFDTYESYINIAHGLAHIFTAKHDNHDSRNGDNVNCEVDRIMGESLCLKSKTTRKYCLEWSQETENDFTEFFKSRARCNLLNEPRGLYGYQPRKIFMLHQQCQCYGFQTLDKPFMRRFAGDELCEIRLRCIDGDGVTQKAPIVLDGTTCASNKVCWAGKCTPLQ